MRCGRITAAVLFVGLIFSLVTVTRSQAKGGPPSNPGPGSSLAQRVADLEAKVAALEALTRFQRVEEGEINGLSGPHVIFEGANVHVRSGSGATDDGETLTGLGNLLVGYNEEPPWPPPAAGYRGGSHNMIVGPMHTYTQYGGLVAGRYNRITAVSASVVGGLDNEASEAYATVTGGHNNTASGYYSNVSGGGGNEASGPWSSVCSGIANQATVYGGSVSGGQGNTASGLHSRVCGGVLNEASGLHAAVMGGSLNTASGYASTVSGGNGNSADGGITWETGHACVNGGQGNTADGAFSTVSGGNARTVTDTHDWAAGSLWEDF